MREEALPQHTHPQLQIQAPIVSSSPGDSAGLEMALELFYALLSPNQDCPVWKSKEAFLSLCINNSFIQPTLLVIVCNRFCIRMAREPSGGVK